MRTAQLLHALIISCSVLGLVFMVYDMRRLMIEMLRELEQDHANDRTKNR